MLPDQKATTAVAFLRRVVAFYARYGIRVERVLSDNGGAYISVVHTIACRQLGIKHLRIRPYRLNARATPRPATATSGWAYAAYSIASTATT